MIGWSGKRGRLLNLKAGMWQMKESPNVTHKSSCNQDVTLNDPALMLNALPEPMENLETSLFLETPQSSLSSLTFLIKEFCNITNKKTVIFIFNTVQRRY